MSTLQVVASVRVLWMIAANLLIIPETIRLHREWKENNNLLALAMYREQGGKIIYLIIASGIFFYTSLTGNFVIFGINAAYFYVVAEFILVVPTIRRKLNI